MKVFDDAVSKWVQAFAEIGVRLKAQRGGTPADITFCWGKVDDTEEGGHVPGDLGNLASFFRDRTIIPVTVTLNQDKWWGGHGLKPDSPDGLGCMARMCLLGASGNPRRPVNTTNGAPQRSLGKANPLRAWFGTYLWDRRRTSPMGLLLTLDATLMSGAALA